VKVVTEAIAAPSCSDVRYSKPSAVPPCRLNSTVQQQPRIHTSSQLTRYCAVRNGGRTSEARTHWHPPCNDAYLCRYVVTDHPQYLLQDGVSVVEHLQFIDIAAELVRHSVLYFLLGNEIHDLLVFVGQVV